MAISTLDRAWKQVTLAPYQSQAVQSQGGRRGRSSPSHPSPTGYCRNPSSKWEGALSLTPALLPLGLDNIAMEGSAVKQNLRQQELSWLSCRTWKAGGVGWGEAL